MRIKTSLIAVLCLVSPALYAHTGAHIDHSLISGLLHPLTGIDHLLVLMAVGFLAAKQGGKALFAFPAVFLALTASGALLNTLAVHIPFVESWIALSLVVCALLISLSQKHRSNLLLLGASIFALFHGYVHAAEIPAETSVTLYFSALTLMSLMVCLTGCVLGLNTGKRVNYVLSLLCLSSGLYYLAAV